MSDKSRNAETGNNPSEHILAGSGKQMVEASPSGMILVDVRADDMPIVYVNAAFETLTGYASDEAIGRNCRFLQGDDRDQPDLDIVRDAIENEQACTVTLRNYRRDGTLFWNELSLAPLQNADGQVTHFMGIQNDVTERERTNDYLQMILDSSLNGIMAFESIRDKSGQIVDFRWTQVNQKAEAIVGRTQAELLGKHLLVEMPGNREAGLFDLYVQVVETGQPLDHEHYYEHEKFKTWFRTTAVKLGDGFVVTFADITGRKRMAEALRHSEKEFRTLVENIPDTVQRLTREGVHLYVNPLFAQQMGMTQADIIGKSNEELGLPSDLIKRLDAFRETACTNKQAVDLDFDFAVAGEARYFSTRLVPEFDEQGHVVSLLGITRDITGRKQMEERLRKSEATIRSMLNSAMSSFTLIDREGRIIDADKKGKLAAQRIFGKKMQPGDDIYDYVLSRDHESFRRNFQRALTGDVIVVEKEFPTRDGRPLYFEVLYYPVTDYNEDTVGVCMSSRDITERKQMEDALRSSEQEFRTLAEHSPDNIQRLDRDGKHLYVNTAYTTALGLSVDQVIGKTNEDLGMATGVIVFFAEMRERVYTSKQPVEFDFSYPVGDEMRYFNTRMIPEFDPEDNVISLLCVSRDITERKRAEEALRQNEERLRVIVDNVPVMLGILSTNGRFEFVNQHWVDKLGWTAQDLARLDDPWTAFYPDPDYRQEIIDSISGSDDTWQENQTLTRHNGIIITRWANIRLSDGRVIGLGQDVTELRQAQQYEFQITLERERHRLLSSFIEGAAHEFRTPLATINSGIYLMLRFDDPDRRKQKAKQVEGQIKRITRLVDNLLLMTRLNSDNTLASDPVDIKLILRTICELVAEKYPESHDLNVEIPSDLPSVMGDADYLSDAFQQLIDNACRFTPEGGKIDVQVGSADNRIQIEIHDSGQGIAEEDLPHIFETFWRQDTAHSTPGFGLGLPIARKIIERHGGDITVVSHPGAGTRVTVTLPLVTDIDVTSA